MKILIWKLRIFKGENAVDKKIDFKTHFPRADKKENLGLFNETLHIFSNGLAIFLKLSGSLELKSSRYY